MRNETLPQLTVAIPTFEREEVLVDTVEQVLAQARGALEVLILDQTTRHTSATETVLGRWQSKGLIRWIRLLEPSIPAAMNRALLEASSQTVLFLDDDVIPAPGLLDAHRTKYRDAEVWAVAGQVLQPGEKIYRGPIVRRKSGLRADLNYPFNSASRAWVMNGMAGNFSVRRQKALDLGGFDENFTGTAYRFETEFCRRICRIGGRVLFEPQASLRHLRVSTGGTRTWGSHLHSASPAHGVGDYYFALRQGLSAASLGYMSLRPFREVLTRFHLLHPWYIPVKLLSELRALGLAMRLASEGPRYV